MNILITGGAGFIGANLAAYYLEQGHKVTVYDNLSRPGVATNITWLTNLPEAHSLTIVKSDILDASQLRDAVKGKDVVFHEAGQTAVTTSLKNPKRDFEVNALGTFSVLESVRENAPEAIVFYASTNKVYGNLPELELKEAEDRYVPSGDKKAVNESQPLDFYSPYGCSKGTGDQYVRDYSRSFGLKTVVFRQSCIYGDHQLGVEDQGWVAHFVAQVLKDQPITIFGDGKQVRDLLYIKDLVSAYDLALNKIEVTSGQIYNIGGGLNNTASLKEILASLTKLKGKALEITHEPERLGDQKYYVSDIAKAKKDFGWEPTTNLETGLQYLYSWLEHHLK